MPVHGAALAETRIRATQELIGCEHPYNQLYTPIHPSTQTFRNVYMLSVAAEDDPHVPERAVNGLKGWVECFEKASFAGSLFCGGINDPGEAVGKSEAQEKAYGFGRSLN